jgi:hypothetical protein
LRARLAEIGFVMQYFNLPNRAAGSRVWIAVFIVGVLVMLFVQRNGVRVFAATGSDRAAAPVLGGKLPPGYREWQFISLAVLGPPFGDVRAKLGNSLAIAAYRKESIPFPDGAIIARLAWKQESSEQNNDAFRQHGAILGLNSVSVQKLLNNSFVAGPATNVQFMVKDSQKYASTGGWGFAQFTNGKPDKIRTTNCMACHASAADHDFVFTRYSP